MFSLPTTTSPTVTLFLAVCLVAGYTDIRWRRVPNALCYAAMAGVLFLLIPHGFSAVGNALLAIVVTIGVGSVFYGLGWLGGGDVKLLAAGAAAFGFPESLVALLSITSFGGVLAAVYAYREGRLRTIVTNIGLHALAGKVNVTPAVVSTRIPYALAIGIGSYLYVATESVLPWFRLAR